MFRSTFSSHTSISNFRNYLYSTRLFLTTSNISSRTHINSYREKNLIKFRTISCSPFGRENTPIQGSSHIISEKVLYEGKHLRLVDQSYTLGRGDTFKWEKVARIRSMKGKPSCVIMFSFITRNNQDYFLLLKQFRPALSNYCIEVPAGLIDPGESIQEAAKRELEEETGYKTQDVEILDGFPLGVNPGIASELASVVKVKIDGDAKENQNPLQKLEPTEDIEVFEVNVDDIEKTLKDFRNKGFIVDLRLQSFALGLSYIKKKRIV